jgi:F-type H+-transporting ATPase subunit alpha
MIFAGTNGLLDDLAVEDLLDFEKGLYDFMDSSYPQLGKEIAEKKALADALRGKVRKALEEFKAKFLAERKAAAKN